MLIQSMYIAFVVENNDKDPKFKVEDHFWLYSKLAEEVLLLKKSKILYRGNICY